MPLATANGVRLHYALSGPETGEPLLLICGLGMQAIRWPEGFLDALAARGFRTIAMDNRDVGLSQGFDEAGVPDLQAMAAERNAGRWPQAPYDLSDMAADCAGLLDALGIEAAHVMGMSMGGMIAQLVACDHRAKALSLTSIMSTTSEPGLPPGTPAAMEALSTPRPHPDDDLETFLALSAKVSRAIGSPAFPAPEAEIHARALADARRAWRPQGFARQYAAIMASPGRAAKLAALDLPATVIHGVQDPLVPFEGGKATAEAIPGCELVAIEGMGHDLPTELHERIADAIAAVAARARTA
ncbi:alpha/beta hydrolase [Albimonas sp. CAU 1670]|uniref:alpha/beta fold hydrolase n=1 Tax=Albimonas sp. CAU 1670 TaxID=3032599 RepID=UPI0023DC601D|nr:alpha/beta hydrolase [Albimonas sp. CAU 1670]MDF2233659.1 alpha/beta hydrolase [Albimonas sp. CAU 1670]